MGGPVIAIFLDNESTRYDTPKMTAMTDVPHDTPGWFDSWWDRRLVCKIHHQASFGLKYEESSDASH